MGCIGGMGLYLRGDFSSQEEVVIQLFLTSVVYAIGILSRHGLVVRRLRVRRSLILPAFCTCVVNVHFSVRYVIVCRKPSCVST